MARRAGFVSWAIFLRSLAAASIRSGAGPPATAASAAAQACSLTSVAAYRESMGAEIARLAPPAKRRTAISSSGQPTAASRLPAFSLQAATAVSASPGIRDTSSTAPALGRRRLGPVSRRESRSFIAVVQAGEESTPDAALTEMAASGKKPPRPQSPDCLRIATSFFLPKGRVGMKNMAYSCALAKVRAASITLLFAASFATAAWAEGLPGIRLATSPGQKETTADIMQRQAVSPPKAPHPDHELEYPNRSNLPQTPNAPAVSQFPAAGPDKALAPITPKIHTTGVAFDGATLTDTGAFPPDSMGTVGPSQYIVFVNGRIRSFTKAGVADGVINADPDVFFASVTT